MKNIYLKKVTQLLSITAMFATTQMVLAQQVCNDSIEQNIQADRYIIENGVVIDLQTNLQWSQCSVGQTYNGSGCEGVASPLDWKQALEAAQSSEYQNIQDWRLPNIKELKSLVKSNCASPAIDESLFPLTQPGFYWSSTPSTTDALRSYIVDFDHGKVNVLAKGDDLNEVQYARLVRKNVPANIPPEFDLLISKYDHSIFSHRTNGSARNIIDEDGEVVENSYKILDTNIPNLNLRVNLRTFSGFYVDFNYGPALQGEYYLDFEYTLVDDEGGYRTKEYRYTYEFNDVVTPIELNADATTSDWEKSGESDVYDITLNNSTYLAISLATHDGSFSHISLYNEDGSYIVGLNGDTNTTVLSRSLEAGTYYIVVRSKQNTIIEYDLAVNEIVI